MNKSNAQKLALGVTKTILESNPELITGSGFACIKANSVADFIETLSKRFEETLSDVPNLWDQH